MNKLVQLYVPVLLTTFLTGCSLSDNVQVKQKASDLQEQSVIQVGESKVDYEKEIEIAKQYELNAVLTLSDSYKWNSLGQGDSISKDEISPLGSYSADAVEKHLGVTKSSVQTKIAEYNNKALTSKDTRVPMSELTLSKEEKIVISSVNIHYYSITEENRKYIFKDKSKLSNKIMQVVTVTSDYGVSEYCYLWEDSKVVNVTGFNNL